MGTNGLRRPKNPIPNVLMNELYHEFSKSFGNNFNPETWEDDDIRLIIPRLPVEHRSYSINLYRHWFNNIRKRLRGDKRTGKGSPIGSKQKRTKPPDHYLDYLKSPQWAASKAKHCWLDFWEHRCSICNAESRPLDHHHRTYARLGSERFTDVIVVCRRCHDVIENDKQDRNLMSLFDGLEFAEA